MSSDEDDFGGFGLGAKRRKRGGNKEDAMLGLWADKVEKEERFSAREAVASTKPMTMNFVSAGKVEPNLKESEMQVPKPEESDDDDEDFMFDAKADSPSPAKEDTGASAVQGPQRKAFNNMSQKGMSNTYGRGFKLMQKMGYSGGGLGSQGQGIANPIEVKQRQAGLGLQDEGEKVGQNLYGETPSAATESGVDMLNAFGASNKPKGEKATEGWKASKQEKRKTEYKTARELLGDRGHNDNVRIVDMTGPQTRVLSNMADAVAHSAAGSLKELRFNMKTLIELVASEQAMMDEKKKGEEEKLVSLSVAAEAPAQAPMLGKENVRQATAILNVLRKFTPETLRELGTFFSGLKKKFPLEFEALDLGGICTAHAAQLVQKEVSQWNPLIDPVIGIEEQELTQLCSNGFKAIVHELVVPRVRKALLEWNPREAEPAVRLVEVWGPYLKDELPYTILPRLQAEVSIWDPRHDQLPIHLWIHPWLPYLRAQMESLWEPIRYKFVTALGGWKPDDKSALKMLRPWKSVLDTSNWEKLMQRIMQRMVEQLAKLPVRPSDQKIEPIEGILEWSPSLIPWAGIALVFDEGLFPTWLESLAKWLKKPDVDWEEVLHWYEGWKSLFPDELRSEDRMKQNLGMGLQIIQARMRGEEIKLPELRQRSGLSATGLARGETPTISEKQASVILGAEERQKKANVDPEDMNIKDYVEQMACENDLTFRPRPRLFQKGAQVYQLGKRSVYFDKEIVFINTEGESWTPISVEDLVKEARAKKA